MAKTWLITGSSRGLGASITKAALEQGERVIATARMVDALRPLADRYGSRVRAVALDVTDPQAAVQAVQRAVEDFGTLDVLVNNAGFSNVGTFEDTPPADFRAQIETNFFGSVNVTRAALPVFRAQRSGHLVQITSIGGRIGAAGQSAYQSAKWALEGFSEALASEIRPLGIRVTIVEPGAFRTEFAGAMHVHCASPDYAPIAVNFELMKSEASGRGDPERAAQALLNVVADRQPPLRLLLGTDAVFLARSAQERQRAEDERWYDVAVSTDFPGQPDPAEVYAQFQRG